MAKFKTSINLADAVRQLETSAKAKGRTLGKEFFVVVQTFDFGRDVNGNKINKYQARLHHGDLVSVQNNYTRPESIEVLTSPRRREQSYNEGADMAIHWLEKIGYDLAYESMTTQPIGNKKESYRIVYRVTNNYLKTA